MLSQESERQIVYHLFKRLADLEQQKITVDGIIGLLPVWIVQRLHRQPSCSGQQPWKKSRTLEEMAEDFALSQRCGVLIYEIFTSRRRMAYTQSFSCPPTCQKNEKFNEGESTDLRELEYWQHDFMDTYDRIIKWY